MFVCFIAALASGTEKDSAAAPSVSQCSGTKYGTHACAFLGTGYNIITGNPYAEPADPGWTSGIFDSQWINAKGELWEYESCSYASDVSSISGGRSAQASLKKTTKISASAGGWGAKIAFTGSKSVNQMNNSAWHDSMHVEEARASCQLFYATLPPPSYVVPEFLEGFEAAVNGLPSKKDLPSSDETLERWMSTYGTHYASGVTMGGMMVRRWTMKDSTYHTLQEDGKKKGFSVDVGYKGAFSAAAGASDDEDKEATKAVMSAMSNAKVVEFYLGGTAFVKGDAKQWAAGLKDNHVPVPGRQNELSPITELLTQRNFPGLDPGIQATAEEFAQRLCTPGGPNLGLQPPNTCTTKAADPDPFKPVPPPKPVDLCHCTESGSIKCSVSNDRTCGHSTLTCAAAVDTKVPFGEWTSLCAVKAVHDGDGYLGCQPGCEVRPTKDLAAAICKANAAIDPSAPDALAGHHCEASDNGWLYLANHMCLCAESQPTTQGASVCSNNCNGYGCCTPGQVCMSSKIINSPYNRCFDIRASWMIKNAVAMVKNSVLDKTEL